MVHLELFIYNCYPNFIHFLLQDWDTVADDDFDWLRNNGQTSTGGTGPDTDHTFGTAAGYYAYADATNQDTGNQAFLMSETFPSNKEMCLSFWYHMNGDHIGSLGKWVMLPGIPYVRNFSFQQRNVFVLLVSYERGSYWVSR